jgi:hypothetical protein
VDKTLSDQLFKAYRTGLLRPPQAREPRARQFDFLFRQVFWLKIPLHERLPVWKIWRLSSQGLRESREGRLDAALATFLDGWTELETLALSSTGRLLAATFLESGHAYFEYKRGEFDLARARVLNAMETDLQLEQDADFNLLELHRIQLAQNLMRIDLKAGEPKRALGLAGQLLAYTAGLVETLPIHHSWQGERALARTPRSPRRVLIAQIANEVAQAFPYFPAAHLEEEFLANARVEGYLDHPEVVHEQFRLWLLAKHAFHQGDRERYLELLLEFLPTGRVGVQAIWYAAVIDLLALCREEDGAARDLQNGILRDAGKWSSLPAVFRPLVGLPPQTDRRPASEPTASLLHGPSVPSYPA